MPDWTAIASLVIAAVSSIAAVVAIGIAVGANKRATKANSIAAESNKIAGEANVLAERAVEQANRANEISEEALEIQKRLEPPAWSQLLQIGDSLYRLENQSGSDLEIIETKVEAEPIEVAQFVRQKFETLARVSNGDAVDFMITKVWGGTIKHLEIYWRKAGTQDETQLTERRVN